MEEKVHESFPLEPFIHQVSGRSSMLSLDESTLCKTLIPRELAFYESLPDELKPFVPEFRGMIEVEFSETCDGYVALTARPPLNSSFTSNSLSSKRQAKHRIRRQESGCIEIESAENSPQQSTQSNQSMQSFIFENGFYYEKDGSNSNINCAKNNSKHNPWVLRCQQQHLNRLEFDKSSQDNTISNKVTKSMPNSNVSNKHHNIFSCLYY
jgi:inositol-hexakisphosphate kinase